MIQFVSSRVTYLVPVSCCGARCAPCPRRGCVAFAARLGCPISSLPTMRLRQLSTPAHTYAPLYLPLAARSNAAAATATRQEPPFGRLLACMAPAGAHRSGRFLCHRQRSHRSPGERVSAKLTGEEWRFVGCRKSPEKGLNLRFSPAFLFRPFGPPSPRGKVFRTEMTIPAFGIRNSAFR